MNRLLKFIFKSNGFPIDEAIDELKRIHQLSAAELEQHQSDMSWKMFHYHVENNAHYRTLIKDSNIKNWADIPVMTKSHLQVPLDQALSEGYLVKDCFVNNTSGSTGTPFYFAKDKYAHAMTWAVIINRFGKHGITFGRSLQARFYGIPLSGFKFYKEKIKDFFTKRYRFPVFDLSDTKMEEFRRKFEKKPFQYANGYTSSLVLFAKYLIKKGISAKQLCPTLQVVVPTSEMCDESDRKILEKGFGVKVVNEYGASELDLIAMEDENGKWILNNETLFIEVVDDKNQPVKAGEEGRILITSLYNKAMPFIRYDLGDIAVIANEKVGKYQILNNLIGRTNDFAVLPSGKKAAGLTFYYISKALMAEGDTMKEFIIKQIKLDEFVFEYVSDLELTDEQKKNVQLALDKYLEPGLKAIFEKKMVIERTSAGKLKHFQSLI